MSEKAPGKYFRQGMSFWEVMKMFSTDAKAAAWFTNVRWPNGPVCPHCGSVRVQSGAAHPTMPYRCRERGCRRRFSVRTGTVMQASNLGYQIWAMGMYLFMTNLKSVSSMKLHRDLNITQKSAWHLAHRLRAAFADDGDLFGGPVEVDVTYMGGLRANMPRMKREQLRGRGAVGKTPVLGVKDRATGHVRATVAATADTQTVHGFVMAHVVGAATIYSDDALVYHALPPSHESVNHRDREYVRGEVHTNGVESFWAMLKRAHKGTFHKLPPKHLNRYVQEFAAKNNLRRHDTMDIMEAVVRGMVGKVLKYATLIADTGRDSGARRLSWCR